MMSPHPRTWFPLVLFGLTMALLIFVFSFYWTPQTTENISTPLPEVTEADYEAAVQLVMADFWDQYGAAETNEEKLDLVTRMQNNMLSLVVTPSYQANHLEFVIALNLMEQGLENDDSNKVAEGERRLEAVYEELEWL